MSDSPIKADGNLVPEEQDLARALIQIADKYGKFNEDQTGIWADYHEPADNPYAEMGVKCGNCVLYRGGEECAVVAFDVDPEGYCRFAVIPDGVVDPSKVPVEVKPFKKQNLAPVVAAAEEENTCPPATQDIAVNLANREKAIEVAKYGPLNPKEPNEEFWAEKANRWSVTVTEAKKSRCGTCVMFIRTPKMLDCVEGGIAAGDSGSQNAWDAIDQAELGYCEAFDFKCAASRTCSAWVVGGPITEDSSTQPAVMAAANPSRRAPKKDRVHGSKINKPGSASGSSKLSVRFSAHTEAALRNKVASHNKDAKKGHHVTLNQLRRVYRRGAGAFSSSHRQGITRDQWAFARVNAYLHLLKTGKPANANYVQDNDILPAGHPRSTKGKTAGAYVEDDYLELTIELREEHEYDNPEHVLLACAEISGLGYELIPALRATWLRATQDDESPFERVVELATNLYESRDADLLPRKGKVS